MRLASAQVRARLSHMPAHASRTFYPQVRDTKAQRLKHGANSGPRSPPGMSGGSRLTPGGEQVMERARRPPSSRGRRSRRVSAAPLLEGAAEELLHALVRARARDEVPPRRLIGSPGPRSSLSTSPFYHPRRYLRPISPRRAEKVGFVPNKCQIRVDGATAQIKRKAKGVPY